MVITTIAIALQYLFAFIIIIIYAQTIVSPSLFWFMVFISSHHDIQYCCAVIEIDTQYPAPCLHVGLDLIWVPVSDHESFNAGGSRN